MAHAQHFFAGMLALVSALACAQGSVPTPPPGPTAQTDKSIVFLASDYRNGGVMGVYRGFEEAAKKLGWRIRLEDGQGQRDTQAALLEQAVAEQPHGIVFGGFDPDDFIQPVAAARRKRIALLGWHAAKDPGPTKELFVNVATRAVDVAKIAADFVLQDALANKRTAGVVIFNDAQYAVANAKTAAMKKTIEACAGAKGCKVLAVQNVEISDAARLMPQVVTRLLTQHGKAWNYSLAINDVYFDAINYPLLLAGRRDIRNVSAGDGSAKALGRIASGVSQQMATVAEPLRMQGFQLADEFNRAFAGAPPSGFQSRPILVTPELLAATGKQGIEANLGFEAAYAAIWGWN